MIFYMDVRVRVPTTKVGQFINSLPNWAQVAGIDKLADTVPPAKKAQRVGRPRRVNGAYVPQPGTTIESVLKEISEKPMRAFEVMAVLKKHNKQAVSSALGSLVRRGAALHQEDGTYVGKKP
jgi:hypothetical protein